MAILNERNENTKGIIHLLTTTLCNRDCKYCCNKQYDMNEILYVTDSELREAHTLCLTGGEPFLYTDPCALQNALSQYSECVCLYKCAGVGAVATNSYTP